MHKGAKVDLWREVAHYKTKLRIKWKQIKCNDKNLQVIFKYDNLAMKLLSNALLEHMIEFYLNKWKTATAKIATSKATKMEWLKVFKVFKKRLSNATAIECAVMEIYLYREITYLKRYLKSFNKK